MKEIEFWFSIGSTYTFLSVTRLKEVEQKFGVTFSWQPFSVRKIMLEMDNIPFPPTKKVKADYMWRDIERRANNYGFEAKVPAPYPLKEFDLANKIAVLGMQEGWGAEYVPATYRRWFVDGLEPGSEPNVSASLREIGQSPERVLELAADDNIRKAYFNQTEQAQSKNIFGSPSYIADGELFWGDDRLEDAVNWALK
ncbi:MAG: DsbA family protein [SAR324 cluster bacterium]|nr:DsbA family protein [SAR324 cluster bacterium]MBL7034712.1 DsbA family protein [SAR324 cluster bacterium]